MKIEAYKGIFLDYLNATVQVKDPKNLYEPIIYILNLGGKRLRPILTLLSCDLFGGNHKKALNAALAVEMFHNFSLVHDDIMDHATLRRGKETVHAKWNLNTGILSGDAMLVMTNQLFEYYDDALYKKLMVLFNKTALEVCEGQQLDIDFETRNDVAIDDYLQMIQYKTAVLVAAALKIGALIAGAAEGEAQKIYDYGLNLGIAFQLQDDFLDVFGEEDFGKIHAGDIIENKKTWLYLKALSVATPEDKQELMHLYTMKADSNDKINRVVQLFEKYDIPRVIKKEIAKYTHRSFTSCDNLVIQEDKKDALKDFSKLLMNRKI